MSTTVVPYPYDVPTPVVSTVRPTTGPPAGGNIALINGSGFMDVTAVTFGSLTATSFTVVSDTVIVALVPPGPSAGGQVFVNVYGPGGSSFTTYTYAAALLPTVIGLKG